MESQLAMNQSPGERPVYRETITNTRPLTLQKTITAELEEEANTTDIALIVMGVLLILAISVIICLLCFIRSQKRKQRNANEVRRRGNVESSEISDTEKVVRGVMHDPYDVSMPRENRGTAIVGAA